MREELTKIVEQIAQSEQPMETLKEFLDIVIDTCQANKQSPACISLGTITCSIQAAMYNPETWTAFMNTIAESLFKNVGQLLEDEYSINTEGC